MAAIHGQNDPGVLPCVFSGQGPDIPPICFGGENIEGRSQIKGIQFTRRQLPDHDRTMTDSLPNTHLKDGISSMSLSYSRKGPELCFASSITCSGRRSLSVLDKSRRNG